MSARWQTQGMRTFIVPAIKPFDHYDFSRAKIACNLAWLVAKAFGTGRRWPPHASLPRSCAHPDFVSVLWSPPPRLARRTGSGTRWAMRGGERGGSAGCSSVKSLRFVQVGWARFLLLDSRSGCLLFFFPPSSDQFCHVFTRGGFNLWYFPHCAAFISPAVIAVITAPRNLSWFRYYWKEVAWRTDYIDSDICNHGCESGSVGCTVAPAECRFLVFVVLL